MPDMDSPGAKSRQNPTALRRANPSIKKPVYRKTSTPKKFTVTKKKYYSSPKKSVSKGYSGSSGGNKNYSKKKSYQKAVSRRVSPKRTPTPKPVQPADKKVIKPPAPPKPVIPDLQKFLAGDSTYQKQLAAYNKSLADFQADQGLARTDYDTNFANTQRDIDLAKKEAAGGLEEDYASRGLLRSGLYNTALGELNTQYQNQFNDLNEQKTGFLSTLEQELKKYQNEQSVQKGNAYNDAVRRRAEKYNL